MLINDICANVSGAAHPRHDTRLFGVEVEYEGVGPVPEMNRDLWTAVPDGSLRNDGVEFITRPVNIRTAVRSFRYLNELAAREGFLDTVRTGIHVHADMRDLTIAQVQGVLAAYGAFEPLMFQLMDPEREENIYCVPWYRAPDQAQMVAYLAGGPMETERLSGLPLVKYSALHLGPLWQFGTLEFRHAPTWRDPALFRRWICAINRLIEWGRRESPESVIEKCTQNPSPLAREIFGWTMAHVSDPETLMDDVNSLATVDEMIPYTYKASDWEWDVREGATSGVGYHDVAVEVPEEDASLEFDVGAAEDDEVREYDEDYNEDRDEEDY